MSSNQDIIATLHRADMRWQAQGVLVGVSAADRIIGALSVKLARKGIA